MSDKTPTCVTYPLHDGPCPDCGDHGPHQVQHDGFQLEFSCEECGMQHEVPAPYESAERRPSTRYAESGVNHLECLPVAPRC